MKHFGKNTLEFDRPPTILSHGAVGGKREAEGPLGGDLDQTFWETTLYQESWERAEAQLQKEAVSLALGKAGVSQDQVDFILAGDLLNQCISSTFGLMGFGIPFLGQYGACSTMAQTLLLASILVESGAARKALAVTSSHFCSAERQFRLPLEYGGQRPPTAQWTATAAGCVLVGEGGKVQVRRGLAGRIQDLGVKDPANMGAAMAPAAGTWGTSAPRWRRTRCLRAPPAPCGGADGRTAQRRNIRTRNLLRGRPGCGGRRGAGRSPGAPARCSPRFPANTGTTAGSPPPPGPR